MPWTNINYPASMKKLPVKVRNKAIKIANAMLKEKVKMKEGMLIATAIKHAKGTTVKTGKKTEGAAKKKAKSLEEKKIKRTSTNKAKIVGKKKAKRSVKKESKSVNRKGIKKSTKAKAKAPVIESSSPEIITHGEDLHFIPEKKAAHPVTAIENHQLENRFHQQEEVALHQELKKVKDAMATRRNAKRYFRVRGQR